MPSSLRLSVLLAAIASASCESAPADDAPAPVDTVASEAVDATPPPAPYERPDVRSALSIGGKYTIKWRPTGGVVPTNEHFELDLWLFRGPDENGELEPVTGAIVVVRGWMPEHGHGMLRQPQATDRGDGRYRVKGMLLHMGGYWQLFVDVIEDGISERTQFDIHL